MRLGVKHQNQTTVVRADFSGGLNTSMNVDGIGENQLNVCVNLEADHSTGRLKTVAGTKDILNVNGRIFAAMYDEINGAVLLVGLDRTVYIVDLNSYSLVEVGQLTGTLYPVYTSWEDGILIASGGKLQYYNGRTLDTIADSPTSNSVYVRAGRILVTDDANIRYSGVGDETNWTEDSSDDSSSKFIEVGYKDGGRFIAMANLSSDILMLKDNRRVYRLAGEYPQWVISEVSRNVECSGRLSYCAVADRVFILGKNEVQVMQTVEAYGDVKPQNIASLVTSEIQKLPDNALMRYVPPLGQVWIIGKNGVVLMYDTVLNSWYKRQFNSPVIDVVSIGDEVFVVKQDRISKLEETTFYDDGLPLNWKFKAQRLVSQHDFLLKRTQISIVPISSVLYTGQISVGAVIVPFPIAARSIKVYHNNARIYKNHVKIGLIARQKFLYAKGDRIYHNLEPIYGNENKIFSRLTLIKESRNVYRSKFLEIKGSGSIGGFILNGIIFDIAEV